MRNQYEIRGDTVAIFLTRNDGTKLETLVDSAVLQKVTAFPNTWFATWSPSTNSFYSISQVSSAPGQKTTVSLHRLITECPATLYVDHVNHDTLDNRLKNLRLVSQDQNMQNRQYANRNSRSGVRCVWWEPDRRKWRAMIRVRGRRIDAGRFENLIDAEEAVKVAIAKHMPFSLEAAKELPAQ